MIVRVSVVLRRTVCGDIDRRFDNLSGSHHQSQVNCELSVDVITSIDIVTNVDYVFDPFSGGIKSLLEPKSGSRCYCCSPVRRKISVPIESDSSFPQVSAPFESLISVFTQELF